MTIFTDKTRIAQTLHPGPLICAATNIGHSRVPIVGVIEKAEMVQMHRGTSDRSLAESEKQDTIKKHSNSEMP